MSESKEDAKPESVSTSVVENGITSSIDDNDTGGSSSKPRRVQFSQRSQPLIDEANRLLSLKPTGTPTIKGDSLEVGSHDLLRSSSTTLSVMRPSNPYKLHMSPSIGSRVGFEDVITDSISSRKPAWKELRESIKDSYYKPKRVAEQQEEIRGFQESLLERRPRNRRSTSPFTYLSRQPSHSSYSSYERGPYASPAVSSSQGIESSSSSATESRYERLANDIEARLLKTTYGLTGRHRLPSTKDFRRAPEPATGSLTEAYLDEAESIVMPRPYYSRPNRRDPDYFDFDLQHSVDLFRKPEGRYIPKGPSHYDSKLLGDYKSKGEAPLSGHMFTQGESDYRSTGTSLLSAALRTPSFWEHRFSSIGNQVRESNPVSFASLERNRPVPNKFTEYRDPDFENLDDDLSD